MDCWRSRVVYPVTCLLCGKGYTVMSLYRRLCDHMAAMRRGNCGNAVGKIWVWTPGWWGASTVQGGDPRG